jgi:phytoene desaturase
MKKVIVIGSGFAGLSAATHLAHKGFDVTLIEKNSMPGGRAQQFESNGFVFDMGPSWYWMPDIFDAYFDFFGKKVSDYYHLIRLDPSYNVFFQDGDVMHVPAKMNELEAMFEKYEAGSSQKLKSFLAEAKYKYEVGIGEFVHKPSHSIMEFADWRVLKSMFRLQMFSNISAQIRRLFKNPKLVALLEFPVLFLGAKPQNTPALYSLMNYADMSLGTWYPMGGMHEIVKAMVSLAEEKGVKIILNEEVKSIEINDNQAKKVVTNKTEYAADIVVSGADYHHTDQVLLPKGKQNYSESYWDKRVMAPSSLLFYLGINKKLKGLEHHNLFFDEDFDLHAVEIYENPKWPSKPLFYASMPSVTDASVAPEGCENLFLLIPLAPDLEDSEAMREKYYHIMMERLEKWTGQSVRDAVVFKRSFAMNDFVSEYHSFKGNAYGLANTLLQTAFLKPKLRHKTIKNMFFTGQLTTPGPGVPPSLISGQVVANEVNKLFAKAKK